MTELSVSAQTDMELIRLIAAGDKAAFRLLFERHGERVFRYAHRLINDVQKAEEVTNDVMLEVWNSAARFENRSKVTTWILGIARFQSLNAIRGKNLPLVDVDLVPEREDPNAAADVAVLEQESNLLHRKIRGAVKELTIEHRDVVELTFFQGCSYADIAQIVGCPENTVKTRMYHAKKQLQKTLRRTNSDLKDFASFGGWS